MRDTWARLLMERWLRDFPSVSLKHAMNSRIVRSLTAPMVYQSARHSSPMFHKPLGWCWADSCRSESEGNATPCRLAKRT